MQQKEMLRHLGDDLLLLILIPTSVLLDKARTLSRLALVASHVRIRSRQVSRRRFHLMLCHRSFVWCSIYLFT